MTVYVDALVVHSLEGKSAQVRRTFKDGACHLFTDSVHLLDLHAIAHRIGMRSAFGCAKHDPCDGSPAARCSCWFQNDSLDLPHYDLNPRRRALAVRLGVVECDRATIVGVMRANRERRKLDLRCDNGDGRNRFRTDRYCVECLELAKSHSLRGGFV